VQLFVMPPLELALMNEVVSRIRCSPRKGRNSECVSLNEILWCIPIVLVFRENPVDCVWDGLQKSSSAFHEFRTVIRNRWSIFEEYGLTGKRFKGKSANWIPKFARRIVSLGERKERLPSWSETGERVCKEYSKKAHLMDRGGLSPLIPIHLQRNHGDSENPTV